MIIKEILCDKKKYLDLLLIGDEQESMILKYLDKSRIFGLYDPELKAICAVEHMPDKSEKVVEIKNIAVYPKYHHKGYGTKVRPTKYWSEQERMNKHYAFIKSRVSCIHTH